MHAALSSLSQRSDLLAQCDTVAKQARGNESSQDSNTSYARLQLRILHADILLSRQRSFIREFIQQLLAVGVIEHAFAVTMDPMMINDSTSRLQTEAFEHGYSIEVNYHTSYFFLDADDKVCSLIWIQNSLRIQVQRICYHWWRKFVKNPAIIVVLLTSSRK